MTSKGSGQTARKPRLIWGFAGLAYHIVGGLMSRLICILSTDYTVDPVLSGRSEKKTNYRLMQAKTIAECSKPSAMLLTFIKLPFVIGVFFLSFLGGCLKTRFSVSNTNMYFLFCGV